MYRLTKVFRRTYWRSIADAFWRGVGEGFDDEIRRGR